MAFEIMISQELFEILCYFLILVLATVFSGPLRVACRVPIPSRDPRKSPVQGPTAFTLLLGLISRPLAVLFFTALGLDLLRWMQGPNEPFQFEPLTLKAWTLFWTAILLFNLTEGVSRVYYRWRGQTFPYPQLIVSILRVIFMVAVLLADLHFVMHLNVSSLVTSTAIFSAAIGLALKDLLGDLLSGMVMHLSRSVVPSDWIMVGHVEGEVISTSWHETRLRTNDGHIYIIPNSQIVRTVIHNMTWPDSIRRHVLPVMVSYADAPDSVKEALVEAALSVADVLRQPMPDANIYEFTESGIVYRLRFWSDHYYNRWKLQGDVGDKIWYQFKRRRIEIPLPIGGKTFFSAMGQERRSEEQRPKSLDLLAKSDFVTRFLVDKNGTPLLNDHDLGRFASRLRKRIYGKGETIFRQGELLAESCYIVIRGTLACRVEFQEIGQFAEYEAGPGALVGEIGLLTGIPRAATVIAQEEVELLEINRQSLDMLLAMHRDIAPIIADLAAERISTNLADLNRLASMNLEENIQAIKSESILKRLLRLSVWGRGSSDTPPV